MGCGREARPVDHHCVCDRCSADHHPRLNYFDRERSADLAAATERQAPGTADPRALHTSYALQSGYEPLIRSAGMVTDDEIDRLHSRLSLADDPRDVLAARDSVRQLLGIGLGGP